MLGRCQCQRHWEIAARIDDQLLGSRQEDHVVEVDDVAEAVAREGHAAEGALLGAHVVGEDLPDALERVLVPLGELATDAKDDAGDELVEVPVVEERAALLVLHDPGEEQLAPPLRVVRSGSYCVGDRLLLSSTRRVPRKRKRGPS